MNCIIQDHIKHKHSPTVWVLFFFISFYLFSLKFLVWGDNLEVPIMERRTDKFELWGRGRVGIFLPEKITQCPIWEINVPKFQQNERVSNSHLYWKQFFQASHTLCPLQIFIPSAFAPIIRTISVLSEIFQNWGGWTGAPSVPLALTPKVPN